MSFASILKVSLIGVILLFLAIWGGPISSAQGGEVGPVHLISGDVTLPKIEPESVQITPDAVFDGKYFRLIQFHELPTYEMRQQWARQGLALTDYLPDNTYFAVVDERFDLTMLSRFVTTVAPVMDEVRMESTFAATRSALRTQRDDRDQDMRLTITFYAPLNAKDVMADLQSQGAVIEAYRDYSSQVDVRIPARLVERIAARPYVQFMGPAFDEETIVLEEGVRLGPPPQPQPEDYYHNTTGRSNYINSGYNGISYNGDGVTIAVGEGGTADNFMEVYGRLIELMGGNPGHHKIGCIRNAASAGNLDPTERNNAWGATVMSITGDPDYVAYYNNYSLRFVNHSFGAGGPQGGYCQRARDHDARVQSYPYQLVSYSSGNVGSDPGYPPYDSINGWANITACYKQNKNHLVVRNLDRLDNFLSFGCKGPASDGRILPHVIIEGEEGTSFASPKVVGIMAILAQIYKSNHGGQEAPATLLRAILLNTADDMDDPGPDFRSGYGRPNVRRAYQVLNQNQFLTSSITNTGDSNTHTIAIPAGVSQLRVMLMWPDKPAAINADPTIVNDLDMIITDTAGTGYQPWVLDHTPDAAKLDLPAVRKADHLNTMEQVTVDNPPAGNWSIQVSGHSIPQGPQTYYIVYEFLEDSLQFMFPLKDVRLYSGDTYYLRWDSFGGIGAFDLDYQLDGGAWVNIVTGYDANSRVYEWTAPNVGAGIHSIKFRVRRGALTAESDINTIGSTARDLRIEWACGDTVKLSWLPVAGADGYYVYHLGAKYMEKATSVTFDGSSAIVSGINPTSTEAFAISAYTGANEGLRTTAITKAPGDVNCYYVHASNASVVSKSGLLLNGVANPHNTTLSDVHFEYGPTTSYGSATANIPITVSGHDFQKVSASIVSNLHQRTDVLHFRLVGKSDGALQESDDQEARLAPGNQMTFDGSDDYINLGSRFQVRGNAPRTIAMWAYVDKFRSDGLFQAGSVNTATDDFSLLTRYGADNWRFETGDWYNGTFNITLPGSEDTWHFYAVTYDGSTLKFYYDGELMVTRSGITLQTGLHDIYLGSWETQSFHGSIDEASFWDRGLSQSEIRALMHHPLSGSEPGLIAYYHFDGRSDKTINLADGWEERMMNGVAKQASSAPVGMGGSEMHAEAVGVVHFVAARVSINFSSASGADIIASRLDVAPNVLDGLPAGVTALDEQYWVIHRQGTGSFQGDVTFTTAEDLTAADAAAPQHLLLYARGLGAVDDWQFVTAASAVDAANDAVTFPAITAFNKQFLIIRNLNPYLNADPNPLEFPPSHPACEARSYQLQGGNLTGDVIITPSADFQVSTSPTSGFAASITVSPSGSVIDQTIYVKLANTSSGSHSGSITHSSSGMTDMMVDIPSFRVSETKAYAYKAMKFDGNNDNLDILNLNWNPNSRFTVEFWLNPASLSDWDQRIGNGWGEFLFESNTAAAQTVDVGVNNNAYIKPASGALQAGVWQHFAFTLDGAHARLYRNGQLAGELTNSDRLDHVLSHFLIGSADTSTINGLLDEFRLWDRPLTQQEIQNNMHNVIPSNAPGLITYLQFNNAPAYLTDYSAQCQHVVANRYPVTQLSTAPVGTESQFIQSATPTSVGESGKSMTATITSTPNASNYLGIYRIGKGIDHYNNETFPAGVDRRSDIIWGIQEYGDVTADLIFDYSQINGVTDPTAIKLLKRHDAASDWADVTSTCTHNTAQRTFTCTGLTEFSEYSIGSNSSNPLAVTMKAFPSQESTGLPAWVWTLALGAAALSGIWIIRRRMQARSA